MKFLFKTFALLMSIIIMITCVVGIGWIALEQIQEGSFFGFVICLVFLLSFFRWLYKTLAKPRVRSGWLPWDD